MLIQQLLKFFGEFQDFNHGGESEVCFDGTVKKFQAL